MLHIPQHTPKPYVYATSWWNADTVDQYLRWAWLSLRLPCIHPAGGWAGGAACGRPAALGAARLPAAASATSAGAASSARRAPRAGAPPAARVADPPPARRPRCCLPLWPWRRDRSQPIWVSLSQGRAELYRDILQLELGNSPHLQE